MDASAVDMGALLVAMMTASVAGPRRLGRLRRRTVTLVRPATVRVRALFPEPPRPLGRPIEEIARDAHRLGREFRCVPDRGSFARFEGCRRAYDWVLIEACNALDVDHLLGVVPPGPELDVERLRVEAVLDRAGLRLDGIV